MVEGITIVGNATRYFDENFKRITITAMFHNPSSHPLTFWIEDMDVIPIVQGQAGLVGVYQVGAAYDLCLDIAPESITIVEIPGYVLVGTQLNQLEYALDQGWSFFLLFGVFSSSIDAPGMKADFWVDYTREGVHVEDWLGSSDL